MAAGNTTTAMAKLGKNQPVHMEILLKICKVLDCQIEDVVEITEDVIDKAKKIKDANDDIRKIDDILNDSTSFHHKADTLYTCYKRIQSREKRAKEKRNIMNTRYLIVTDYFENDGIRDVADDIQRLIDENPNRVLFFPDGVYNLSKPILTPAAPKTSVCLQLSMYAVIRPHTDWNSDEALIRLGAKEPANDIHTIGSNYYLEGGIIDGGGFANGVSIDGGRETSIRNVSIKHTKIGIHIKYGANYGSSDADIFGVNIVGNNARGSIGVLVNGWDNTFTNMRIDMVQTGFLINSSGNIFRNLHPLYESETFDHYLDSRGFLDNGGSNFYDTCYSDQFCYGFEIAAGKKNIYSNCFTYWYTERGGKFGGFKANGKFESVVNGLRFSYARPAEYTAVLSVDEDGGDGKMSNLAIANEDTVTDKSYKKYL